MTQSLLKPKALNKEVKPNTYPVTLLTFIFDNCLSLVQQLLILKRVLVDAEEKNIVLLQSIKITSADNIGKKSNWGHCRLLPNLDKKEQTATIAVQCGGLAVFQQSCL